jgi:hypothetical protein
LRNRIARKISPFKAASLISRQNASSRLIRILNSQASNRRTTQMNNSENIVFPATPQIELVRRRNSQFSVQYRAADCSSFDTGGALAKRAIFTNRTNLNLIGGLALTLERDAENATSTARTKAMDSAFGVTYSTFRFDSTTFNTALWLYPSITSPGRVRMTLNQDVYYKFLKGLLRSHELLR